MTMTGPTTRNSDEGVSLVKEFQFMGEPNSAREFRQQVGLLDRAEIRHLIEEVHEKDQKIAELRAEINRIYEWQKLHEETLKAAKRIVDSGLGVKAIFVGIFYTTAAIGGLAAAWEGLRVWFQK